MFQRYCRATLSEYKCSLKAGSHHPLTSEARRAIYIAGRNLNAAKMSTCCRGLMRN